MVESGAKCSEVVKICAESFERRQTNMLSGEFRHTLDPKNRLFIPAKHREALGENIMIVRSIRNECLQVYSMEKWMTYIEPIKNMPKRDSERVLRALHKDALEVSPDAQGRIVLSPTLIGFASITKGAVVVGCGEYAEIWAEEIYDKTIEEEDTEEIREILESFGL